MPHIDVYGEPHCTEPDHSSCYLHLVSVVSAHFAESVRRMIVTLALGDMTEDYEHPEVVMEQVGAMDDDAISDFIAAIPPDIYHDVFHIANGTELAKYMQAAANNPDWGRAVAAKLLDSVSDTVETVAKQLEWEEHLYNDIHTCSAAHPELGVFADGHS